MIKTAISFLLILAAPPSTGVWVQSDGTSVTVPCPRGEYSDSRARLPKGCETLSAGIWLSVSKYKEMEVEISGLKAKDKGKSEEIARLKKEISKLQSHLLLCTAVSPCPTCPSISFKSTFTGAVIGASLTAGGCLLWTQSH